MIASQPIVVDARRNMRPVLHALFSFPADIAAERRAPR